MSRVLVLSTNDSQRTSPQQLALDEAVLNLADPGTLPPTLRIWQFREPVVVLGRSSSFREETNRTFCELHDVPVLRRCSGGASVVGGPGCLMYSLVVSLQDHPGLRKIDAAHDFVMERLLIAARRQNPRVERRGICDLTIENQKFSGNSLRITRGHLLYHGTVLHDADLDFVSSCLAFAPRQPDYRAGRGHRDFITNLRCDMQTLTSDLRDVFEADSAVAMAEADFPTALNNEVQDLLDTRYNCDAWHRRH